MDVRRVFRWLAMSDTNPGLAVAQLRELFRHLPMLHGFLALNVIVVAYSHHETAPFWLTVIAPAVMIGANAMRFVYWLTARRHRLPGGKPVRVLRRTAMLSVLFAAAYIGWALALESYGGVVAQAQIAVYVAITVVGFIFCMAHLPQAATGIAVVAVVPYLAYHFIQGDVLFAAIATDVLLVTLVVFRVLLSSFKSFQTLVRAKEEAERLHGEVTLLAHTDMLTGLPNRRLFYRELEKRLQRCNSEGLELALGIIDLDRFKIANDTYGHQLGDELLEMVGARLRKVFGRDRLIARLGGDEFAFAVFADGTAATVLAEEACQALSVPYKLGETLVQIGATCGIGTTADVVASAHALYDGADYALYQAKAARRGSVMVYSIDHERKVTAERAIEMALQSADFNAELDLHLQPIVDMKTGAVIAVEALARWNSPHLGAVRPDIFIPIAERAGMTHSMTLALFQKALAYTGLLPPQVHLSFNLSALDLNSEATVLALIAMVLKSSITPSRLMMELTETAAMRDFAAAEQAITTLRSVGIRIALDDFGTGQSSLSYLHRLPIDKVKLDRSFLMEAGGKSGREMLGAVVALCHSMQMQCVAEGVEEDDQLKFLEEIGCDLYQGFHFAKPMPVYELLKFLRKNPTQLKLVG